MFFGQDKAKYESLQARDLHSEAFVKCVNIPSDTPTEFSKQTSTLKCRLNV